MSAPCFGLQIEPQYGFLYDEISCIAKEAERLGFESIWISDHFFLSPELVDTPCLECWSLLSALARDTSKIRIGAMVTSQSYRNPALLAKLATTVDHLSKGRLNFGIGAGWKEVEYRAYGYPFPNPGKRVKQLEETIKIAKLLWTKERATFKGKYYQVDDALCSPKPLQQPHPPIWVGGTGAKTLLIAAEQADAVNFAWSIPIDAFDERLSKLRKHCKLLGRDYSKIRRSAGLMITMASEQESLNNLMKRRDKMKNTPYMKYLSRQSPNIMGTTEDIAKKINDYIDLGVDHFILRFHYGEELENMRLFIKEVRPLIKQ